MDKYMISVSYSDSGSVADVVYASEMTLYFKDDDTFAFFG